MIITMRKGAPREQIDHVIDRVTALGFDPRPIFGVERTVIAAVGDERGKFQLESLASAPGVEKVTPILQPFKLVGSEVQPEPSTVEIAGVKLERRYKLDAPKGVNGRTSDTTLIQKRLGWEPSISLREGMEKTYAWIREEYRAKYSGVAAV